MYGRYDAGDIQLTAWAFDQSDFGIPNMNGGRFLIYQGGFTST